MANMEAQVVFTIGYEGSGIDDFISRLKSLCITRLIDIRELPLSRKKGFSKSQLRQRIEAENIEYVHIRELGSPAAIRHQLKEDLDYERYFSAYSRHLSENQDAIIKVHDYVQTGLSCLMCYERSYDKCHRSVVATRIKEYDGNGLEIIHV